MLLQFNSLPLFDRIVGCTDSWRELIAATYSSPVKVTFGSTPLPWLKSCEGDVGTIEEEEHEWGIR